jgi:hypothetical protein
MLVTACAIKDIAAFVGGPSTPGRSGSGTGRFLDVAGELHPGGHASRTGQEV